MILAVCWIAFWACFTGYCSGRAHAVWIQLQEERRTREFWDRKGEVEEAP